MDEWVNDGWINWMDGFMILERRMKGSRYLVMELEKTEMLYTQLYTSSWRSILLYCICFLSFPLENVRSCIFFLKFLIPSSSLSPPTSSPDPSVYPPFYFKNHHHYYLKGSPCSNFNLFSPFLSLSPYLSP